MINLFIQPRNWNVTVPCSEANPDAWYPESDGDSGIAGGSEFDGKAITAKSVCFTCPVRLECLEEAMERNERHGIWGGLTTKERGALRKKRLGA